MPELCRQRQRAKAVEDRGEGGAILIRVAERDGELDEDLRQPSLFRERLHCGEELLLLRRAGRPLVREAAKELRGEREPRVVRDAPGPVPRRADGGDPREGG